MTAIIANNKAETLRLLKLIPEESLSELAIKVDNHGFNLIHYLARYNHEDAVNYLRGKVSDELFTEVVNKRKPFDELPALLDVIIENKRDDLLPLFINSPPKNSKLVLQWLESNIETVLPLSSNSSVIKWIENHFTAPGKVVSELFPFKDINSLAELMLLAAKHSCVNILKYLLSQPNIANNDRIKLVSTLCLYVMNADIYHQIYTVPDVTNTVAIACKDAFEKQPELLASVLVPAVGMGKAYIMDCFLQRVSDTTRSAALSHQLETGTLAHIAVANSQIEAYLMLNQFGAADTLTDKQGVSVRHLAKRLSSKENAARIKEMSDILEKLTLLTSERNSPAKIKQAFKITKEISILEARFSKLETPTNAEFIYALMSSPNDHAGIQKGHSLGAMYSRLVGKIIDGASNPVVINLLEKTVLDLRAIYNHSKDSRGKSSTLGLASALVALKKQRLDEDVKKVYISLNKERLTSIEYFIDINLDYFILENSIIFNTPKVALAYVGYINRHMHKIVKDTNNYIPLAGSPPTQVILARMSLMFFDALNKTIPNEIQILFNDYSKERVYLREKNRIGGYGLNFLVTLPLLTSTVELDDEQLNKLIDFFNEDTNPNEDSVVIPDNILKSPDFVRNATETYASIHALHKWIDRLTIQSAEEVKKLERTSSLLSIKIKSTKLLAEAGKKLDCLLKKESSSPLTKQLEQSYSAYKELLIQMTQETAESHIECLPIPKINPLLFWEINKNDSSKVMKILRRTNNNLLSLVYHENFVIADCIAEKLIKAGLKEPLQYLLERADSFNVSDETSLVKHAKMCYLRLRPLAIVENQQEIKDFLASDKKTNHELRIAPQPDKPEISLLFCLRARNLAALPEIMPTIPFVRLTAVIPQALELLTYGDPVATIQQIISLTATEDQDKCRELFALAAIYQGKISILLQLIVKVDDVKQRLNLAYYCFNKIGSAYQDYEVNQEILTHNERVGKSNVNMKKIFNVFKTSVYKSKQVIDSVIANFTVYQLGKLLAKEYCDQPEELLKVLKALYGAGYVNGMRELLLCLPSELTSRAINSSFGDISLFQDAIKFNNNKFWYLFQSFGGDINAKCFDRKNKTLLQYLNALEAIDICNAYSEDDRKSTSDLKDLARLNHNIMDGLTISEKEISMVISAAKSSIKQVDFIACLEELWRVVAWCGKSCQDTTSYDSALQFAIALIDVINDVNPEHYLRAANLAHLVGNFDFELHYIELLEKTVYQKIQPDDTVVSELTTTKLRIILCQKLGIHPAPEVARFCIENWDTISSLGKSIQIFLPLYLKETFTISLVAFDLLLVAVKCFSIPEVNKNNVTYTRSPLDHAIGCCELLFSINDVLDLLLNMEQGIKDAKLAECRDLASRSSYDAMLWAFYSSCNKIFFSIKDSLKRLNYGPSEDLYSFEKRISEYYENSLVQTKVPKIEGVDSADSNHKLRQKKPADSNGQLVKPARLIPVRTYISPEELNATLKTPTYLLSIMPPGPTPQAQSTSSSSQTNITRVLQQSKQPKIKLTSQKHFPELPQEKIVVSESPLIVTDTSVVEAIDAALDTYQPPAPPFDQVPREVVEVLRWLDADLTGGAVRDILMGKKPKDFDIEVKQSSADLKKKLDERFGERSVNTEALGVNVTWTVMVGGLSLDFCSKYTAKRDFTINAICWNPDKGIKDSHDGMQDIANRKLRFINPNESFVANQFLFFRLIRHEADGFTLDRLIEKRLLEEVQTIEQLPYLINNKEKLKRSYSTIVSVCRKEGTSEEVSLGVATQLANDRLQQRGLLKAMQAVKVVAESKEVAENKPVASTTLHR